MKAVIFAGGFGTRLSEETSVRPKPMVEIGHRPILWHIMKIYSAHGINDFVICCGYKGHIIKRYFVDYPMMNACVTVDMKRGAIDIDNDGSEPWRVVLADTGSDTMTGGRLKRVSKHLDGEPFCLTYGDGVAAVDVRATIEFHAQQNKLCTMTAVQPPGRWGAMSLRADDARVGQFREKPRGDDAWINGGFFVCDPKVIDYIKDDSTVWERDPLRKLARDGQLVAYRHTGFWQPMDTLHDKNLLEDLWASGRAPWKVWQ
jgi:glucose-1-phosphate cytidylyltransferase